MTMRVGSSWVRAVRRWTLGTLAVMGSAWLAGCYQFIPLDPGAVRAGTRVRAQLTPGGAERLAAAVGSGTEERVEGRIVEVAPNGGLLLEVYRSPREAPVGVSSRTLASRVSLQARELAGLELKQLDRGRTALFLGGSALMAGILVTLAFSTYGRGSEGGGPPVDEAVVPLFTIRW